VAWSSVNTLGSANDKTAGTSVVMTVSATAEAGNVVAVVVACNNNSTVDGDNGEVLSISDSAGGNTWEKAGEFTNGQGTAAAGATVSVWYSVLATQLTASTHTITANFVHSPAASAITAWEFTMSVGNAVSVTNGTDLANDGADPGSMNLTPANEERLWVRGIAHEGPVADAFAKTAAYSTAFTKDGTTGGGGATNMSVCGEFDIFTGTSNASDPTWTAVDHASVLVTLKEIVVHAISTSISAAATVAVAAAMTYVGVVSIPAAATVSGGAVAEYAASTSVSAEAAVSAAAGLDLPVSVSISASGAVSPTAAMDYAALSSLEGTASVSAAATVVPGGGTTHEISTSILGEGMVLAAAAAEYALACSISGSAAVSALGSIDLGMRTLIEAMADVQAKSAVDYAATAHLLAQGHVAATAEVTP